MNFIQRIAAMAYLQYAGHKHAKPEPGTVIKCSIPDSKLLPMCAENPDLTGVQVRVCCPFHASVIQLCPQIHLTALWDSHSMVTNPNTSHNYLSCLAVLQNYKAQILLPALPA